MTSNAKYIEGFNILFISLWKTCIAHLFHHVLYTFNAIGQLHFLTDKRLMQCRIR